MEKQYSEEFFCTFVDNLQKLCRNFLDFEQVCEVSGYVCLMMDNSKQERYVLSEMVHNSGSVISESYCTKAFRTLPLVRNIAHPRKHYEHNFSPEFDEDYGSSMDSCTHSSMDSYSGEVPHGLTIASVQSLSSSQNKPAVTPDTRNTSHMTNVKSSEESRIVSDKDMMKTEACAEPDPKNVDRKKPTSPQPLKIMIKKEICEEEEEEEAYDSIKSECATTASHEESFFPHQRLSVQHGPVQHTPLKHGPGQHGPGQHGPGQHGPTKHAPVQHAPIKHGPGQHGPVQHGPGQHGPVQHGPAQHGPAQHGPGQHGPGQHGPVQHGPGQHAPIKHGPGQQGPVQRGSLQQGPVQRGSLKRGPVQHDFAHRGPDQRLHPIEELVQVKQEPEDPDDPDFMPSVEINSSISDMNILKDEFLIAEPIGYLKSKDFSHRRGPKTKTTPRKVYVPLNTSSRPGGNPEIQPRKFIKLVHPDTQDQERVARHIPEHFDDEEPPDSDSDFMYDSNDSLIDSCSDMDDEESYHSGPMIQGHLDLPTERHHTMTSSHMDRNTNMSPDCPRTFTPSNNEKDTSNLPPERHQTCPSSEVDQSSNLPPDDPSTFKPSCEKDSLQVEKQPPFVPTRGEQSTKVQSDKLVPASSHSEEDGSNLSEEGHHVYVSSHTKQGSNLAPDSAQTVTPGSEKESPNLSIERQDTYTSSHMEKGIALRAAVASSQGENDSSKLSSEQQDTYTSSHMEKGIALRSVIASGQSEKKPNLTIERQDTYTSSHMEKGIALRVAVSSSHGEKDNSKVSMERPDTYTSSHMEKGIALHSEIASSDDEQDSPNLCIERQDVYTSSHMAKGIAMRAAVMSGHSEKDKIIGRQDTYTSSRMEQGIALRTSIASSHSEQDSFVSHHIYEHPHIDQVTSSMSTDTPHPFVSGQMEQKPTNLPPDTVMTSTSGHMSKGPTSMSNIQLMEESGDEIIELDSDDIEEDEGLAAATASLSQHKFSQPGPNEPSTSTSSQSTVMKEPQKHTMYAINLFTEYHRQQGNSEPMHLIPPQKLDLLLANFYENVRKNKTGEEFTPFSLKNIQSSLQKYLREHNYPYSITSDSAFSKSREILRIKIEELKSKGKSIPQKVDVITEEDVEIFFQKNLLGACSPDTLFNTMWFMNTMFLGIKSRIEHCNLKWGDIVLNVDHTGREFLRYAGPKQSVKNRSKPVFADIDEPDRCFVELYKIYEDRRPPELLMSDAPFYGTVIKFPTGEPWFLPEPTPSTRFNGILQKMAKEAGLAPGRKFTNSSSYVK